MSFLLIITLLDDDRVYSRLIGSIVVVILVILIALLVKSFKKGKCKTKDIISDLKIVELYLTEVLIIINPPKQIYLI